MKGLLAANLKAHGRRYTATGIAIMLATTFIMLCFGVAGGFSYSMRTSIASEIEGAQGAIETSYTDTNQDGNKVFEALQNDPNIESVEPIYYQAWVYVVKEGTETGSGLRLDELYQKPYRQPELKEGKLPEKSGEIVLTEDQASTLNVQIGSTLVEDHVVMGGEGTSEPATFTVVGIEKTTAGMSMPSATVADGEITNLWPQMQPDILLYRANGMNDKAAATYVKDMLDDANLNVVKVQTSSEYIEAQMNLVASGLAGMLAVVLIFPGIAAVTAIIVISTTFQVMLTQRQRELALLRSIGADSSQIRRLMLKENVMIGLLASLAGLVAGSLLAAGVNVFSELTPSYLAGIAAIPWWGYVATIVTGVLITLVAGLRPALRASRLSPMVALQPVESNQLAEKRRIARLVTGLVVTLAGGAILVATMTSEDFGAEVAQFGFAFIGSAISFIGVLIFMSWLLPYITRGVGKLFGVRSVTMQMAGENTWRNPGRTGATGAALVLGLTLVVMMMVGASSMQKTMATEIDTNRPIDIAVTMTAPRQMTEQEIKDVRSVKNIEQVIEVDVFAFDNEGEPVRINKGTELSGVAHTPITTPKPGTIAVNGWLWVEGQDKVTFEVGDQTFEFEPVLARTEAYTLAPEDYDKMRDALGDQAIDTTVLYARVTEDLSMSDVNDMTNDIQSKVPDTVVGGSALERAFMMAMINGMLIATVVMLGVSIVVALVGVANTLALSVVERRRENGLLRALGMTRGNIRSMITWETLLITVIAVLIGVGLGIGYGIIGIKAMPFGELGIDRLIVIPWLQVIPAAAVAVLAALVASILPARSASKATPVEALAAIE
ncbi:MAG: FtsX-like permease family protein [Actinomycetaceae bacterium]|nr:FtsX-like permease family protein [Actinomycetaceae bacterium]